MTSPIFIKMPVTMLEGEGEGTSSPHSNPAFHLLAPETGIPSYPTTHTHTHTHLSLPRKKVARGGRKSESEGEGGEGTTTRDEKKQVRGTRGTTAAAGEMR